MQNGLKDLDSQIFAEKRNTAIFLMDSMAEQYGRVANKMTKKHGTKYNDTSIRAESKM